jgi:hypothetical protein
MRTKIALIFTFLLASHLKSQNEEAIKLGLKNFIPSGHQVLSLAKGDLNWDGIEDVVLVLNKKGEDTLAVDAIHPKRKCLIFFAQKDKSLKLFAQNDNIVYQYDYDHNFKEAFVEVRISKGEFSVDHYGGFNDRLGRATVFKYNAADKKIYLIRDEHSSFSAMEPETTAKEKIYTAKNFGKVSFEKFDAYKLVK